MSMADEVITLVAGEGKKFMNLPVKQVKDYQGRLLAYFAEHHPEIASEITKTGRLEDAQKDAILKVCDEFDAVSSKAEAAPAEQ